MDTKQYLDFIRDTLQCESIRVADTVNKLALEAKHITIPQYSAAAQLIAAAYLETT